MKKLTAPRLIVGSPNVYADILHITGFRAPDSVVVLQTAEARHLVVSRMEEGRARLVNPALMVWTPESLDLPVSRRRRLADWALAVMRRAGVRRVDVPATFPLGTARRLERAGVRLHIVDGPLVPEREIKRSDEVESIRTAQRACVAAMRAARAMIRAARMRRDGELHLHGRSLTSEDIRRAINRVLLDLDCVGGEPIVACGREAADPHAIGHGPLRAGEPIVIDIFPQHLGSGYWGDITRTVVKGRPSARLARLYRAVLAAQLHGLSLVRAGQRYATIHRAVGRVLEQHGFHNRNTEGLAEGFIHGTGHGVGLEIHEAPSLGRGEGVLRAGQVVTIEPGLYYRDIGGLRVEDTVLVTRAGFEFLATCPKTWVIP